MCTVYKWVFFRSIVVSVEFQHSNFFLLSSPLILPFQIVLLTQNLAQVTVWVFVYHRLGTCAQYVTYQQSIATRHRESLRSGAKRFEPASSSSSGKHDTPQSGLQNKIIRYQLILRHFFVHNPLTSTFLPRTILWRTLESNTKSVTRVVLRFTCTQTLFISPYHF